MEIKNAFFIRPTPSQPDPGENQGEATNDSRHFDDWQTTEGWARFSGSREVVFAATG
jgi:hypothetical protein